MPRKLGMTIRPQKPGPYDKLAEKQRRGAAEQGKVEERGVQVLDRMGIAKEAKRGQARIPKAGLGQRVKRGQA